MIDILSKTDKSIVKHIVSQGLYNNLTFQQAILIIEERLDKESENVTEDLIQKGAASKMLSEFKEKNFAAYSSLKQSFETQQTQQTQE